VNLISSALHLLIAIYCINIREWGLVGAGIATSINNILKFIFIEMYFVIVPDLYGHVWAREVFSLHGIRHFMGLAIPSFFLVFIEWSCFEFTAVIAGWCSTIALSAHVSVNNVIAVAYMIPSGMATAISSLTGACLGEGSPELAKEFTKKGILLTLAISTLYAFAIHIFVNTIAQIYTADESVLKVLENLLHVVSVYVVADAVNCAEAGILRGLGKQSIGAKYQSIVMYGVLLPLAFVLHKPYGVIGIWTASLLGMITSAAGFAYIIYKTDYSECARRAFIEHRASLKV